MRPSVLLILLLAGCAPSQPAKTSADVPAAPAPPPSPAAPVPEDLRVGSRPWIDPAGTAIVGFGVLRLVPDAGRTARFDLRYEEKPGDYGAGASEDFQLFVLPGDAFATKSSAYADEFLAFTRTHGSFGGKTYTLRTTIQAAEETTVLVCYGPWTAPDSGRPAGDKPVFRIDVTGDGGAFEWIESEAGELITNNWTNRPDVKRGGPYPKDTMWVEVRPLILYDGRMVRAADEPEATTRVLPTNTDPEAIPRDVLDRKEEAEDQAAIGRRADRRVVMTRELAEKFRRVPIRWR